MALLADIRDRALTRPWLLAPPLLGLLGQNLIALLPLRAILLTALMTSAVSALFAELWIGDGWSVTPKRFLDSWKAFLIPYPLLFLFGLLTTPLVYWFLHAELTRNFSMSGIAVVLGIGKIAAFFFGAASSLAAARRGEASGAWAALKLGGRSVLENFGFFLPAFAGLWLFQEACVFLANALVPSMAFTGLVTTALPLLGCVAFPVEAWRSGRLK